LPAIKSQHQHFNAIRSLRYGKRMIVTRKCGAGIVAAWATVVVSVGFARQSEPAMASVQNGGTAVSHDAWNAFTAAFAEDYFKTHPFFAVRRGRHEFDGQMSDWSAAGFRAEIHRLKTLRARVENTSPTALDPSQRFERGYLLSLIRNDLFWLDEVRAPFKNPAWYLSDLDPQVYLTRDYAPLETRLEGYLGYARAIPRLARQIRANLRTPLPGPLIEQAVAAFGGYAEFFRDTVPKVFVSIGSAEQRKSLDGANRAASRAMDELKAWFVAQRRHATRDFAMGADLYSAMLRETEDVDLPLSQLEAIGETDLQRNTAALKLACEKFLPLGSLRACIDKMNANKPEGGALEGARALVKSLRQFVVAKDIVTIPGTEDAVVAEAPPYNRGNFAYIASPGAYEKGLSSVYYISPPDPSWNAKEREDYIPGVARLTSVSVHEVWPGHLLQFLHADRNPSPISKLWTSYAFAEGWAHYCEEMMLDMGYGDGNPELRVGQITDALLRDVRFLSSIGMHTRGMTPAQSETMFLESAYQDAGNARQQALRGTYDPAYLKYTLGKLMIRKLRDDWLAQSRLTSLSTDPKRSLKAFHDALLSYGGAPIPLIRQEMVGSQASLF
jgi:uncharacterized protein (DUF885 family)